MAGGKCRDVRAEGGTRGDLTHPCGRKAWPQGRNFNARPTQSQRNRTARTPPTVRRRYPPDRCPGVRRIFRQHIGFFNNSSYAQRTCRIINSGAMLPRSTIGSRRPPHRFLPRLTRSLCRPATVGCSPIPTISISAALRGAGETLARCRPTLHVGNDRLEGSQALIEWLRSNDYRLWWPLPPRFNPGSFFGRADNIDGGLLSCNMLACPASSSSTSPGSPR